jgi:hypothetical protein
VYILQYKYRFAFIYIIDVLAHDKTSLSMSHLEELQCSAVSACYAGQGRAGLSRCFAVHGVLYAVAGIVTGTGTDSDC